MKESELNKIKTSPYVYSNIRVSNLNSEKPNSEKPKMEICLSPKWTKTIKLQVQSIIHSLKEFQKQLINIDAYLDQDIQNIQKDIEKISEDVDKTVILKQTKEKRINILKTKIGDCQENIKKNQMDIDKYNTDIANMEKSIRDKRKDQWGGFIKRTFNFDIYGNKIKDLKETINTKTTYSSQLKQELEETQNKLKNSKSEYTQTIVIVDDLSKKLIDLETRKIKIVVIHSNVSGLNVKINKLITDCSSMETFRNLLIPETAEEVKKDIISKFSGENITLEFPVSETPFFDNPEAFVFETLADPAKLENLPFEQRFRIIRKFKKESKPNRYSVTSLHLGDLFHPLVKESKPLVPRLIPK